MIVRLFRSATALGFFLVSLTLGAQTPPTKPVPASPTVAKTVPPGLRTIDPAQTKAGSPLSPLPVRTFPLNQLKPEDAIRLLRPYLQHPNSGISSAGSGIAAVTVREEEQTLATVARVLAEYDRSPAILTFRFQLIAADDTAARDPSIASVDSVLRDLFKFRGYRLLAEGAANASQNQQFQQTIGAGTDQFTLEAHVNDVRIIDGRGTVSITVSLRHPRGTISETNPSPNEMLLSTGLTVPFGQTVVLGSAVSRGPTKALILTVRPEVAGSVRR
jgi:hypothetical protein